MEVHVIDASEAFEREVVTPFCQSYCEGRTPNPCILCNPAVKFRLLAEKADELGISYLATGHYARIERCADGGKRGPGSELYALPVGPGYSGPADPAPG